ncbi:MAG: biotin/lipoyl-binding protein [Rhodospirillales bacterium]|nr:biotin/lipoyl-binding protein [Rhodospirillales bacterium]
MTRHLRITVDGKVYDVVVEDVTEDAGSTFYQTSGVGMPRAPQPAPAAAAPAPAAAPAVAGGAGTEDDKLAPLGGVILEVVVKVGDAVKTGDKVAVIEAMKMKTVVSAHKDGTVSSVAVKAGDAVDAGQVLLSIS